MEKGQIEQLSKSLADSNFGDVMVVGGGISGIQASLDLATAGFKVYLIEKSPACPSTPSTSVKVKTSMLGCRPTSTSLGERIHMEQSLVG